jgi:hypothetical protein
MKADWRKVILYITVIGMEGCWLYALTLMLNKQTVGGVLSVPGIILVYLLAFVVNLLLYRLKWHRFLLGSLTWFIWAAVMLLTVKVLLARDVAWSDTAWLLAVPRAIADVIYTFRPELLVLLLTAVMWWMGRRMSRTNISFNTTFSEFQFGLVMLVIVFFIASQSKTGMGNPVPLALAFFFFALVGISVAHASEGTSWLAGLYRGHWSGLLILSIGLVFILGLIITVLVSPDILQAIWSALKWLWAVIWGVILRIMAFLAGLFPASEPKLDEIPPMPSMPAVVPDENTPWSMPDWLRNGLRIGWVVLMIGFIIFAIWRISSDIFRWMRRRQAGRGGAEYERLHGAFRFDILNLVKSIVARIKGWFRPRIKTAPVQAQIATVLQIYRQFLRWAAAGGHARQESQTPYEFRDGLADLMPEAVPEINLVTGEYVKARYGAWVSSPDELNELNRAWHRVKKSYSNKGDIRRTRKKEES